MTYKISVRATRTMTEEPDVNDPRAALELAQLNALSFLQSGHSVTITVRPLTKVNQQPGDQPPTTHTAHLF